ncbi:hypothetical protein SDC9_186374 [bioreactor metagenome]|uniref:Uncharacterized protein n=1 Tax=bioreactor metagenome TaxID=1076179 RepID=A0A645HKU8_9ZZZZ
MTVEARRRVGGRSRDVEQDGRPAAAVDRADVGRNQDDHRLLGHEAEGEPREERHAHRGRQAGKHSDDDAEPRRPEGVEDRPGGHEREKLGKERRKRHAPLPLYGRKTAKIL